MTIFHKIWWYQLQNIFFKEQQNPLSTIAGYVKGTQIIINAAQRTDPRHFSILEPCCAFWFLVPWLKAVVNSVRYDDVNLHLANHSSRILIICWYNYLQMKKLDELDFPSILMGKDVNKTKYSSSLKSLQKSKIFTDNGMLQQR